MPSGTRVVRFEAAMIAFRRPQCRKKDFPLLDWMKTKISPFAAAGLGRV
jgi:hypothetical protein